MEHLPSGVNNDLIGGNGANITVHQAQRYLQGPQPMEALVATGGMRLVQPQQLTEVTVDVDVNVEAQRQFQAVDVQPIQLSLQEGLSEHTALQISGSGVENLVAITLGPNRSDPIWRLRFLAAFTLVVTVFIGVRFLPGDLNRAHATYWKVMLITSVGAPIAVAVTSLFVSFWLASNPDRLNWITGFSVANSSMLAGLLVIYLMLSQRTGN